MQVQNRYPPAGLSALTVVIILCLLNVSVQSEAGQEWKSLQTGLHLQEFTVRSPRGAGEEDLQIAVLKIDPGEYEFHLLSASENGDANKTLPEWMAAHHLVAAINASMFWEDRRTSTGFMKNYTYVNNDYIHPKYEGFLVFHPIHPSLPEVQIIDREHTPNWRQTLDLYNTVIQSFRMISAKRENVWEQNSDEYSVASIGMTKSGEVLFIFCHTPTTIHDLNQALLRLPLDIQTCIFVEGGPTAGLVVDTGRFEKAWKGTSATFLWTDGPTHFARLPNVVGITKKTKEASCTE